MSGQHALWRTWRVVVAAAAVAAGALLAAPLAAGATTTWTLAASPNPGTSSNTLAAVACPSATECWAVGQQTATGSEESQTLIEEWNGTAWSAVTSDNINATGGVLQFNSLDAVSCDSTTDCWAVGRYIVGIDALPLGEHWNGSSWTASALPQFSGDPAGSYVLDGIACPDAADCWAVGYWEPDGAAGSMQTLIEQWGGSTWTLDTGSSGGTVGYLNGISCVSASQCYAAGANYEANPQTMLVVGWDGSSWQGVTGLPANEGSGDNILDGISCVTASYCWAVGYYYPGSGPTQNLFLNLDGGTWTASVVSAANDDSPSANPNILSGVSCTSDSSCWAVGTVTVDDLSSTLVDAWDGTSWSLVANTPNGGTDQNSELVGVACADADDCAAVGDYGFEDPTLILMYVVAAAPPATPAPVPTSGGGMPEPGGGSVPGLAVFAAGLAALLAISGTALVGWRRQRQR
ncbi:MAG: hypothetical protein ACLQT7_04930 [Candidatus Dormibacteria bacterium]|jgi:hypothetical protein